MAHLGPIGDFAKRQFVHAFFGNALAGGSNDLFAALTGDGHIELTFGPAAVGARFPCCQAILRPTELTCDALRLA
jgi:hypothetical protein